MKHFLNVLTCLSVTKKLTFIAIGCVLATGCGSTANTSALPSVVSNSPAPESNEDEELKFSTIELLEQLQAGTTDIDALLIAAETAVLQKRTAELNALLYALSPELSAQQKHHAQLLLALTSPHYQQHTDYEQWLSYQTNNDEIESRRIEALVNHWQTHGDLLRAADVQASLLNSGPELHHQIYLSLNTLSDAQIIKAELEYKNLRPHLALVRLVRDNANTPIKLAGDIENFAQVFLGHPLVSPLPSSLQAVQPLSARRAEKIVVMLPLSGRYANTGEAIQQGILASYFEPNNDVEPPPELLFLDTELADADTLIESASDANWVIGPLLKERIDTVLPFLPPRVKRLALNRLDLVSELPIENALAEQQTAYYGLTPEDEAIQLATFMRERGHRHPIAVAAKSGSAQRMLRAFSNHWRLSAPASSDGLDTVEFDTIDQLGETLAKAIGVGYSEDNAKQIDRMTNRILYDQTRSRQDVDAIVVFASPQEMALVNPMVEASISPFRQQRVPVYATSRSLDYSKARNTLRDLENVHFLDAPLLIQPQKWQSSTQQLNSLWPEHSAAFSRFYAFGYDAFNLTHEVTTMAQYQAYQHHGMSGVLYMAENNQIKRRLPMAKILQQRIQLLEE